MSHFKDIAHKTLKHIACRPPCAVFFISCAKKLQLKTLPAAKCFLCQFPDLSSGAEQKRMGQLRNSRASENHPPLYAAPKAPATGRRLHVKLLLACIRGSGKYLLCIILGQAQINEIPLGRLHQSLLDRSGRRFGWCVCLY
jgi:hypothetical protein